MTTSNDLTKQDPSSAANPVKNHGDTTAAVNLSESDEKLHALYDSCRHCDEAVDGEDGELDILATISMHLNQTASSQKANAKQDTAAKQQGKSATNEPCTKAGATKGNSDNKASDTKQKTLPSNASLEVTRPTIPDACTTVRQVSMPGAFARRPSQVRSNNGDDDDITEQTITNLRTTLLTRVYPSAAMIVAAMAAAT